MKMRALWMCLALACLASGSMRAQDAAPTVQETPVGSGLSLGEVQPTPEMWFYEQELRRYNDPRQQVRRKAEFRAEQRQHRLAALHWFGYSNARPTASMTPTCGQYSPSWVGNHYHPFWWRGTSGATVVVQRPIRATGPVQGLW